MIISKIMKIWNQCEVASCACNVNKYLGSCVCSNDQAGIISIKILYVWITMLFVKITCLKYDHWSLLGLGSAKLEEHWNPHGGRVHLFRIWGKTAVRSSWGRLSKGKVLEKAISSYSFLRPTRRPLWFFTVTIFQWICFALHTMQLCFGIKYFSKYQEQRQCWCTGTGCQTQRPPSPLLLGSHPAADQPSRKSVIYPILFHG